MFDKKASFIMLFILHGALLVSFVRASPVSLVSRQVGLSDDVQVLTVNGSQVCQVGGKFYKPDEDLPTEDPCEYCTCKPPGFACEVVKCVYKPGCRSLERSGLCCPEYICDCEHEGKIYHNGDNFKDPTNPCSTCQCSGGDVSCSVITCPPSPSEECEELKEEGKCCSSYVCPTVSEAEDDDQTITESVLADTTTLPTLSEASDKTEDFSIDQAQNAVNSLFIHKVILETIKKEKEQQESTVATFTELPISSQEDAELIQTSTLSENYEADGFVAPTTLESVREMDTTSELSVDENLIREVSDETTIRSETETFDPTERSVQEENEMEQLSLVTEDSSLREEIGADSNISEQRETTEISSSDKNIENEANISATEKQVSELIEESTLTPTDTFYSDKAEELFTTLPEAEVTEAPNTKNEETETSVPEIENLIKAAESVITSQTESYLEEKLTPERSNAMETTPYFEERDDSNSDYRHVNELPEQTTELKPLEPRLSDNHETFEEVSTISNTEILDESDGESSVLLGSESSFDFNTVRSVEYTSPTELSDEIQVTTSNYENNSNPKDEDSDLLYVFEEDRIAQASKLQKSEPINIEEITKNDNEIVEETTREAEASTQNSIDTRISSFEGETTTTIALIDQEAVTAAREEADVENLFRFDISENSVSDIERSSDVTSGHYTTEVYSTTVFSEDTETKATDNENALGSNSARKESIDETTTSEIAGEDEFILTEESTTESGASRLLDEAFISTVERSEVIEDNWETTKVPEVRQESEFLTTTLSNNIENEGVESRIESVVETKPESISGKSNETATEAEVKSEEETTEKSEALENNFETTEIPVVRQESETLATTISNKENENIESRIESVVEEKLENASEKDNEKVIENEEKPLKQTTEKSETEKSNWDTTEIPQVQESKVFTNTLSNKEENEDTESKVDSVAETKLENTSEESDEPASEKIKSEDKTLSESNLKMKRKPQDSNIHVFEKILSNGSVTKIETHSSEDRKRPKIDRISTQFHHLARKYGLRPLTRKTFKDDVKNRRRYRLGSRKSIFEEKQ